MITESLSQVFVLTELDGNQDLEFYWIDPIDAMDRHVARPEYANKTYLHYERQESEQRPHKRAFGRANSALVFQEAQAIDMFSVPMLHLFYSDKSFSGQHRGHYPAYGESYTYISQNMRVDVIYAYNVKICLYMQYKIQYEGYMSKAENMKYISVAESLLNFHEDVRRKSWFPFAWFPIYDTDRSKRPSQGYESDAARQMRLFHDCWRLVLGSWDEKTKHTRCVTFANGTRHQVRSFLAGLMGDQQVRHVHCIFCIFVYFLHIRILNAYCAYFRNMIVRLGRAPKFAIDVKQSRVTFCLTSTLM